MPSSLWSNFARRTAEVQQAVALNPSDQKDNGTIIFSEIVAETKSQLNFINPENLRKVSSLGSGSSFQVNREIFSQPGGPEYYVAVKQVLTRTKSAEGLEMRFSGIRRELRVLMHPPLRSHSCIISILGYGWRSDALQRVSPYLVMDYSDHGTLLQYLQNCNIPLDERRELALDVGMALRSLHDCHIIHGDVKIDNVLIFNDGDDESGRPQVAKLADFGCAIFEDDFLKQREVYYLGTTRYNAPEIASRTGPGVRRLESSFSSFKKADIYSFGLLLLEVALNGESFVDGSWLDHGETVHAFLDRATATKEDYILELALRFADRLPLETDHSLIRCIGDTFKFCLRDDASRRGSMEPITKTLSQRTSEGRPRSTRPLYTSPSTSALNNDSKPLKRNPGTYYQLMPPTSDNLTIRLIDREEDTRASRSGIAQRLTHIAFTPVYAPKRYQYEDLDMFQASVTVSPPWDVQCSTAERLKNAVAYERDPVRSAYVHLQLSVLYLIGYGTPQDASQTLSHLAQAATCNDVARCVYPRIAAALKSVDQEHRLDHDAVLEKICHNRLTGDCPSMGILNFLRAQKVFQQMPNETSDHPANLHKSLTIACKNGNFVLAKSLIPQCEDYPPEDAPNPLHWLVMFPLTEAKALLQLLVVGSSGSGTDRKGICHSVLNSSCEERVNLPEYCMDLFGTPLHWATRCGYLDLVSELMLLGADLNKRWNGKLAFYGEPRSARYPSFSPLDIAVTYHFADIVEQLLDHGADTYGGDIQWEYSPFHMIGQKTIPFARYVAHGHQSRSAATRTIRITLAKGLDINARDSVGQTPLICAAMSLDLEQYILEELLAAGASAKETYLPEEGNIATLVSRCCVDRRFTSWKLSLLLNQIDDINGLDTFGRNALHYCALFDGSEMARVLLAQPGIDINSKASDRNTALTYAAKFGSEVITGMLINSGASLEMSDAKGSTPLDVAVNGRQIEVARLLLKAGARTVFRIKSGGPYENILHVAVTNASNRPSVAKQILDILSADAVKDVLNAFDSGGWTPLHRAAYFGDIQGVDALLQAGADRTLFKHPQTPSLTSYGGTPLQLVTRLINKIKKRGLGIDHEAIKREGTGAENHFSDCLEAIQILLSKQPTK